MFYLRLYRHCLLFEKVSSFAMKEMSGWTPANQVDELAALFEQGAPLFDNEQLPID